MENLNSAGPKYLIDPRRPQDIPTETTESKGMRLTWPEGYQHKITSHPDDGGRKYARDGDAPNTVVITITADEIKERRNKVLIMELSRGSRLCYVSLMAPNVPPLHQPAQNDLRGNITISVDPLSG